MLVCTSLRLFNIFISLDKVIKNLFCFHFYLNVVHCSPKMGHSSLICSSSSMTVQWYSFLGTNVNIIELSGKIERQYHNLCVYARDTYSVCCCTLRLDVPLS